MRCRGRILRTWFVLLDVTDDVRLRYECRCRRCGIIWWGHYGDPELTRGIELLLAFSQWLMIKILDVISIADMEGLDQIGGLRHWIEMT